MLNESSKLQSYHILYDFIHIKDQQQGNLETESRLVVLRARLVRDRGIGEWQRYGVLEKVQDVGIGRPKIHLLPSTQQTYNYIYNSSLRKIPEIWRTNSPQQRGKGQHWDDRRGRNMGSQGLTHIPAAMIYLQEGSQGMDLLPEEQGHSNFTSVTPTPRSCTEKLAP